MRQMVGLRKPVRHTDISRNLHLMTKLIVPVILAGGQGTRLWPMSRAARPKQFLPLTGPNSLFQETLPRVADRARLCAAPIIITNADYRFLVAEQAPEARRRARRRAARAGGAQHRRRHRRGRRFRAATHSAPMPCSTCCRPTTT